MLQDQIWLHTALGLSGVSHGCFCLASKASERLRRINTYANNEPRACVDYSSYTKSSYLFLSSVGPSARLSAFISYIKKEAQTHPSSLKLPETVRAKKQNKMKQDLLKVVGVQVREIGAWVIQWSCLCVCVMPGLLSQVMWSLHPAQPLCDQLSTCTLMSSPQLSRCCQQRKQWNAPMLQLHEQ